MSKKKTEEKTERLKVAIYRPSHRGHGYFRTTASALFFILKNHKEDEKIIAYRKTKTKQQPKGDKDLKRKIKAFMPSGDYGDNVARSTKNQLAVETGLVQLDFDQKVSKKEIAELFEKYPWITVAGTSCGGEGFYLLVNTPSAEHYDEYWQALLEFFDATPYKVDEAVSSVNEIRYFSLTSDVLIREDAALWKKRKKKEVSTYTGTLIPHDSKLIEATTVGALHYVDLIALAGLNNSNGVPMEHVKSYFKPEMFSKDSHLSQASEKEFADIVAKVYERYADQHGATTIPMVRGFETISLPPLKINPKTSMQYKAYQVVQNIFEAYLLKTDANTKVTYRYNGTFWEEIKDHDLRNFLSACATASRMSAELNETTTFRDLMTDQLKDLTATNFTVPLNRFNLANGVIEFNNGEILFTEHSDSYMFNYCLDYDYDEDAQPSKLLAAFLNRTIPDPASLDTFFQYVGSAFITDYKIELFLILLGGGANGKSTLIDLLTKCFGGAVGSYSLDKLTDPDGETSAKQARYIYNKVLGVSSEDSRIKDPRIWRKIVSKEPIEVKALYKDTFETTNYARLISCMNDTPYLDTAQGSMRRLVVIGTGESLRREEYDLNLSTKLLEDRSAFLNLIIAGYLATVKNKGNISVSADSLEQTKSVVDEYDVVINYVKNRGYIPLRKPSVVILNSKKIPAGMAKYEAQNAGYLSLLKAGLTSKSLDELYTEFRNYSEDEGIRNIITKRLFAKRLAKVTGDRLGFDSECIFHPYRGATNKELWYIGIRL